MTETTTLRGRDLVSAADLAAGDIRGLVARVAGDSQGQGEPA